MTATLNRLSLRYLEKHPEEAARNIERFSAEEKLTVFMELLPQTASQIITRLSPYSALDILLRLEQRTSVQILNLVPANFSLGLLRRMSPQQRGEILEISKAENLLKNARVMLKYSERMVGSIMNPDIHIFRKSMNGDDVRHILNSYNQNLRQKFYVVDEKNVLCGYFFATDLLIKQNTVRLEEILKPCTAIINVRTPLENAVNNTAWEKYNYLPVVDSGRILLGEVEKNSLFRAARELAGNDIFANSPTDILLGLTETFLDSFSELLSNENRSKPQ